jgi:hypothetical protein
MARVHWDVGISGWISDFQPVAEQLRVHCERLTGLVGQRLIDGWTGWFTPNGRRCQDIPLVLVFERGDQLELAWEFRNDYISVTWNAIDLSIPPTIFGSVCEWRCAEPEPLAGVIGRRLTGFATLESPYFRGEDLDFSDGPPMHALAGWQVDGLWLAFEDGGLRVSSVAEGAALYSDLGPEEWCRSTSWPPA